MTDSLPDITRNSSIADCFTVLFSTAPTAEELAYCDALHRSNGRAVSQYAVSRSVEMKRRADSAVRVVKRRRVLMPLRIRGVAA